jgi:hypothetical protein
LGLLNPARSFGQATDRLTIAVAVAVVGAALALLGLSLPT